MPVNYQDSGRIGSTLYLRAASGADAEQLADAIILTWQGIQSALEPITGPASVALLYRRSLQLSIRDYPWLASASASEAERTVLDLAPLRALLAQQSSSEAAAAGGQILQAFYELLASLIGPHLTEQLLQTVWDNPLHGTATQEPTP